MTMNSVIEAMIAKYNPQTNNERENAIKEVLQEITLAGLSRAGFFLDFVEEVPGNTL